MEATWLQPFKENNTMMTLLNLMVTNIIDCITLEESEELFPDLKDEMDKIEGASSEVDNLDILFVGHMTRNSSHMSYA